MQSHYSAVKWFNVNAILTDDCSYAAPHESFQASLLTLAKGWVRQEQKASRRLSLGMECKGPRNLFQDQDMMKSTASWSF